MKAVHLLRILAGVLALPALAVGGLLLALKHSAEVRNVARWLSLRSETSHLGVWLAAGGVLFLLGVVSRWITRRMLPGDQNGRLEVDAAGEESKSSVAKTVQVSSDPPRSPLPPPPPPRTTPALQVAGGPLPDDVAQWARDASTRHAFRLQTRKGGVALPVHLPWKSTTDGLADQVVATEASQGAAAELWKGGSRIPNTEVRLEVGLEGKIHLAIFPARVIAGKVEFPNPWRGPIAIRVGTTDRNLRVRLGPLNDGDGGDDGDFGAAHTLLVSDGKARGSFRQTLPRYIVVHASRGVEGKRLRAMFRLEDLADFGVSIDALQAFPQGAEQRPAFQCAIDVGTTNTAVLELPAGEEESPVAATWADTRGSGWVRLAGGRDAAGVAGSASVGCGDAVWSQSGQEFPTAIVFSSAAAATKTLTGGFTPLTAILDAWLRQGEESHPATVALHRFKSATLLAPEIRGYGLSTDAEIQRASSALLETYHYLLGTALAVSQSAASGMNPVCRRTLEVGLSFLDEPEAKGAHADAMTRGLKPALEYAWGQVNCAQSIDEASLGLAAAEAAESSGGFRVVADFGGRTLHVTVSMPGRESVTSVYDHAGGEFLIDAMDFARDSGRTWSSPLSIEDSPARKRIAAAKPAFEGAQETASVAVVLALHVRLLAVHAAAFLVRDAGGSPRLPILDKPVSVVLLGSAWRFLAPALEAPTLQVVATRFREYLGTALTAEGKHFPESVSVRVARIEKAQQCASIFSTGRKAEAIRIVGADVGPNEEWRWLSSWRLGSNPPQPRLGTGSAVHYGDWWPVDDDFGRRMPTYKEWPGKTCRQMTATGDPALEVEQGPQGVLFVWVRDRSPTWMAMRFRDALAKVPRKAGP